MKAISSLFTGIPTLGCTHGASTGLTGFEKPFFRLAAEESHRIFIRPILIASDDARNDMSRSRDHLRVASRPSTNGFPLKSLKGLLTRCPFAFRVTRFASRTLAIVTMIYRLITLSICSGSDPRVSRVVWISFYLVSQGVVSVYLSTNQPPSDQPIKSADRFRFSRLAPGLGWNGNAYS